MAAQPRFLSLPAEIRNKIYHNILVSSTPIHLSKRGHREDSGQELHPYDGNISNCLLDPVCEPAFLSTCRQVRYECLGIFYGDNVFFSSLRGPLLAWLRAIGPEKRKLLRFVRGFRSSRYFDYEWAHKFLKNVEEYLDSEGVGLSQGVFGVPFGVDGWDGLVFWTYALQRDSSLVMASREGEVGDCGRRFSLQLGEEHELIRVQEVTEGAMKRLFSV